MSESTSPLVYQLADVARLLGCKVVAARRLLQQGVIPSRRLGRKFIVLTGELEAYLQALPTKGKVPGRTNEKP